MRKKPQPQAERTNCWHTQLSAEQGRHGQRKASTFSAGDLTEDETTGKSNSLQKEKWSGCYDMLSAASVFRTKMTDRQKIKQERMSHTHEYGSQQKLRVGFRWQRLQSSYFKDVQIMKGKYDLDNCTDMESQHIDLKRTKWKQVIYKKYDNWNENILLWA